LRCLGVGFAVLLTGAMLECERKESIGSGTKLTPMSPLPEGDLMYAEFPGERAPSDTASRSLALQEVVDQVGCGGCGHCFLPLRIKYAYTHNNAFTHICQALLYRHLTI
jgi:hypothetical protein